MGMQTVKQELGKSLHHGLQDLANETGNTYTLNSTRIDPKVDKLNRNNTLPGVAPKVERLLDSDFERLDVEYIVSPSMADLGRYLIETKRCLKHLKSTSFAYLWKAKGGQSGGKMTLGKCTKTPPLVKTYEHSTFTIWLAHDHCKEFNLSDDQMEALLYHELCHAVIEEVENEETGDVKFKPNVLIKYVNGSPMQIDVNANVLLKETVWLGVSVRSFDSVDALAEVQVTPGIQLGYSYDFTTTQLSQVEKGSHEIMLSFRLGVKGRSFPKCYF